MIFDNFGKIPPPLHLKNGTGGKEGIKC